MCKCIPFSKIWTESVKRRAHFCWKVSRQIICCLSTINARFFSNSATCILFSASAVTRHATQIEILHTTQIFVFDESREVSQNDNLKQQQKINTVYLYARGIVVVNLGMVWIYIIIFLMKKIISFYYKQQFLYIYIFMNFYTKGIRKFERI